MKDFHDLWALPRAIKLDQSVLRRTLEKTFDRRRTKVPDVRPPGLSQEFANEAPKSAQWQTYAKATDVDGVSLSEIVDEIWKYLEPVCIGGQDKPT